jgi:ketosteroid isomerase-like protein
MKRIIYAFLLIFILITNCTKEVPEAERKLSKSVDEARVRNVIEKFVASYNSGDVRAASEQYDENFQEITSDSLDVVGIESVRTELIGYQRQYPDGKWQIKIDEVIISDGYAFAICSSSFLMPDPVEKRMNPIHSERSIRILRRDRNGSWKIFRYLALPTYSYDEI